MSELKTIESSIAKLPKTESECLNTEPMELYGALHHIDGRRVALMDRVKTSKYSTDNLFTLSSCSNISQLVLQSLISSLPPRGVNLLFLPVYSTCR